MARRLVPELAAAAAAVLVRVEHVAGTPATARLLEHHGPTSFSSLLAQVTCPSASAAMTNRAFRDPMQGRRALQIPLVCGLMRCKKWFFNIHLIHSFRPSGPVFPGLHSRGISLN